MNSYEFTVDNHKFTRKSKRADFQFAVTYYCTTFNEWQLAGLRTNQCAALNLQRSYSGYKKCVIIEVSPA